MPKAAKASALRNIIKNIQRLVTSQTLPMITIHAIYRCIIIITYYHICNSIYSFMVEFVQHRRFYPVIGIRMYRIFTLCHIDAGFSCHGNTCILLMNNLETCILYCIIIANHRRTVITSIINHDYFKIYHSLCQ